MCLNNQWIKEEVSREIRKYLEMKENKTTTHHNLWDTAKHSAQGEINSYKYIKKQFSDLKPNFTTKQLENEEQTKPNVSRRKKIISVRPETNELENLKKI